jgi:hypothetical protein
VHPAKGLAPEESARLGPTTHTDAPT